MSDLLLIVVAVAFFVLCHLVLRGLERLWVSRTPSRWSCPSSFSATSSWPCCSRSVS